MHSKLTVVATVQDAINRGGVVGRALLVNVVATATPVRVINPVVECYVFKWRDYSQNDGNGVR